MKRRWVVQAGRNDSCPCGSGQKYKACCGRLVGRPLGPDVQLQRLSALLQDRRCRELELEAGEFLRTQPECGMVWQWLGWARGQQGKNAVAALTTAVELLPQDPVAHFNLANALSRLGQLEQACASYERALDLNPDFAEAHHSRGSACLQLGRYEQAAACCRRALKIRPDFAEAHNTWGTISMKLCRVEDAIAGFRRAVAIDPNFAAAWLNLANARRSIGLLGEAVEDYGRVLRLDPAWLAVHAELATALRLQQRTGEAETACRRALAIEPKSLEALQVLAELRADRGQFAAAEELFRRMLAIDADSVAGLAGITRVRRMTKADGVWLDTALRLAHGSQPPQRELELRFAMGKYFDDIEEFDRAFDNYVRANRLAKAAGPAHDRGALSRTVDLIVRAHDDAWVNRVRAEVPASNRPVLVVGMLRSGTSLTEQILASHPEVFGAGELTFWSEGFVAAGTELDLSATALGRLGADYEQHLRQLSGGALRVVDKLPTNFLFLGLIHAALPNARIIHMQRHPIDTCLSIFFQHFEAANTYANDLQDLAHYYQEYRRLMQHWRAVLPAGTLLEMAYEDLVADAAGSTRRMLEFIDVPWDPRCLDFHRTARTVVTASKWQVRQAMTARSVQRWRRYEKFTADLRALLTPGLSHPSAGQSASAAGCD